MANTLLLSRRYEITKRARPMTLRRMTSTPNVYISITVAGVKWSYRPDQLVGGVLQGDAQVEILNDEIFLKSWPGPPRRGDTMVIDGRTWTVQGNDALYEDVNPIGHSVWVRGG